MIRKNNFEHFVLLYKEKLLINVGTLTIVLCSTTFMSLWLLEQHWYNIGVNAITLILALILWMSNRFRFVTDTQTTFLLIFIVIVSVTFSNVSLWHITESTSYLYVCAILASTFALPARVTLMWSLTCIMLLILTPWLNQHASFNVPSTEFKLFLDMFLAYAVLVCTGAFAVVSEFSSKTVSNKLMHSRLNQIRLRKQMEHLQNQRDSFFATISHELKNSIAVVYGISDLLSAANQSKEQQKKLIQLLENTSNQLLINLDDLLNLRQKDLMEFNINLAQCNLHKLIDQVIQSFAPKARAKNLQLHCSIAADVPEFILTDFVRLSQILLNLLSNSLKFTLTGEVKLAVSMVPDHQILHILVSDTGIGIAPEHQKSVFEKNVQVRHNDDSQALDQAVKQQEFNSGVGLGLFIVQKIIAKLNGSIELNSEIGQGTQIGVYIPLQNLN